MFTWSTGRLADLNSVELPNAARDLAISDSKEGDYRVRSTLLVCDNVPVRELQSFVGSSQTPGSLLICASDEDAFEDICVKVMLHRIYYYMRRDCCH